MNFLITRASAQAQTDAGAPVRLYGDVQLTTDSIEHGLTQTDHSFALQTGIGYRWPQFRLGLWGSNVKFSDSADNLNLRLFLITKLIFTPNADLNIHYDFNRYFKAGYRDGSIVSLDLRLYEYHVLYESNDNWEGIGDKGARYGFMKEWQIPYSLILNLNAGYNMIGSKYDNFFDVKSQISYKTSDITYSFGNSFNSNSGQFKGRGDLAFFLSAAAQF